MPANLCAHGYTFILRTICGEYRSYSPQIQELFPAKDAENNERSLGAFSTDIDGLSQIPVNSSSNPKSKAYRNKDGVSASYYEYFLTTGGQWQSNSVNTTVPILLGESVLVENRFGSSQTWTVPLTIW